MNDQLSAEKRRDIFVALVTKQDTQRMSVIESKRQVMKEFEISSEQLESIIVEGMDQEWLDQIAA